MDSNNNKPIDPQTKYKIIKLLGEGSYGKAYLVKQDRDQSHFVIKSINVDSLSEKEQKETQEEAKILEKMDHPNIIKFHEVYRTRTTLNIVTEYADGGDLGQKIKAQAKNKLFEENLILDLFTQMCLAIKHIHKKHIIHRDLKSQNIFLTKNALVKIGDFGIAKRFEFTMQKAMTLIGTPYYLSPEIVENKGYSYKSDIWSLGVLLYEMMALKMPFDANSLPMLTLKIMKGNYSPLPGSFSKDLRILVGRMLNVDPDKRPSADEILKEPFIKSRIQLFLKEVDYNKEFSKSLVKTYRSNIKQKQQIPKHQSPNIQISYLNSPDNRLNSHNSNSNIDMAKNYSSKKSTHKHNNDNNIPPFSPLSPFSQQQQQVKTKKKEEKLFNKNNDIQIKRISSNNVIESSNIIDNITTVDSRCSISNKEPDIRNFIKKKREEMKKQENNSNNTDDIIWPSKQPLSTKPSIEDKVSKFPKLIFVEKPQSSKCVVPEQENSKGNNNNNDEDEEDEYNANRLMNNLHQILTEGKEDSDNEGTEESKTNESSVKVENSNQNIIDINTERSQQQQSNTEEENNKEEEVPLNYTSEFSEIEEMRIVLENSLGIELFKPLYHCVDSFFDPNVFKCDTEKIKKRLKTELTNKNFKEDDIQHAFNNIQEDLEYGSVLKYFEFIIKNNNFTSEYNMLSNSTSFKYNDNEELI